MVCTLVRKRDLGIRILSIYFFYQTLFGIWRWRYPSESDAYWRKVVLSNMVLLG